jgi:ArsR family transcriptional regulator
MIETEEELALLAKAIGHPVRVRILRTLASGDSRVCRDIVSELPLAQSTFPNASQESGLF